MRYAAIILLLLLAVSCESEIDVVDESGSVPVIYCILNQDDTVQSLRLTRSYLTNNARIPPPSSDSLNIPGKVCISIEEVKNEQVTQSYLLLPRIVQKDSGFFPNTIHWVYQGSFKVVESNTYRLIIDIKDWDFAGYSSFVSLGDFQLVDPAYPEARKIHMLDDHNPLIHWTKSQNAAVYQVGIRIHYQEISGDQLEEKSIVIPFTTAFYRDYPGGFYSYTINSNQFYKRLSELMPVNESLLRQFSGADVFVIAGSESLAFFLTSQERQDPFQLFDYKNIINGQGVFGSCKTKETKGFRLDAQSLDTLAYGFYTHSLNFLDSDGHRKE
ncbi:MAG TPA: hypothetical protein DC042_00725 [Bacteroidales bacterium]|nr:hypothetical protein [Bacteroidales bacterium]